MFALEAMREMVALMFKLQAQARNQESRNAPHFTAVQPLAFCYSRLSRITIYAAH